MDKKTPLYGEHVALGARMVPFGGYIMPIQYRGIIEEHQAVRTALGMFDLSHMGEFRVTGQDALAEIDRLVTNDIRGLAVGQVRYTPMLYPSGGIVDDLLVYRFEDHLMLVVNAANIEKDLTWVCDNVRGDVQVEDISAETALIAVQGPRSEDFLQRFTALRLDEIAYYHFQEGEFAGVAAIVSRTGYTGEDGFELYLANDDAPAVWRRLLEEGKSEGLKPVGLGARDTLRLEAGYMLYGNDIDDTTTPLEAGLGWTVKLGAHDFIGRDVLERQKAGGLERRMVAIAMKDRAIPRPHYPVEHDGVSVGELTSGTFSPTLGRGVGLGYVEVAHAKPGTEVAVRVRQQTHGATIARKPLYRREEG